MGHGQSRLVRPWWWDQVKHLINSTLACFFSAEVNGQSLEDDNPIAIAEPGENLDFCINYALAGKVSQGLMPSFINYPACIIHLMLIL